MKRKPLMYMHTIDGRPASYDGSEQICFTSRSFPVRLFRSLREIRKNERASVKWRRSQGFSRDALGYGYVLVQA